MPFKAEHALQLLDRARQRGRLGHAYLLCGPKDAGLESFAARVLDLASGDSRGNLDAWEKHGALVIRPESKSRQIKVEAIREVEPYLNVTTSGAAHRFVVFIDAERLSVQAQNAFLRTLEEPPPRTLFLLLSEHPEQFLETILSRVIRVALLPGDSRRRLNDDEQRLASVLSELSTRKSGSLASALGLRREFEEILESVHERIEKQLEGDFDEEKKHLKQTTDVSGQWLGEREKEMLAAVEARYLQERDALMELLLAWIGDVLRHQAGATSLDLRDHAEATRALAQRWDAPTVSRCLGGLRRLNSNLHTNVNETLALDVAFIEAFG